MKPWMTKLAALALMAGTYLVQRNLIPPGFTVLHVHVAGALSALVALLAGVGISGPQLWPALAKWMGNGALDAAKKASALVLVAFLGLSGCSHVTPVVKDCGAQTVAGLIDDVNSVLACSLSDTSAVPACVETGLASLIAQFGECAITAAVQEVAGTATAHASFDATEAVRAARAKAWLAAHPVKS